MLVPLSWLKKYVKIDLSVEEFVRRMIMSGTAVEGYEDCGAEISNVVVGKLVEIVKHPNSDHLNICQVDVGGETPIQIVTGADNMSVGDLVPVALHDSHLPGGVHITRGKLRGEVSNGMMCSGEELGVPAEVYPSNVEHGLLILKGDLKPGQDIKPVLGLDDTVIDFDILANRPDCLSVLGLAHEASVAAGHPVVEPNYEYTTCGGDINELVKVRVDDPDLCTRYCAAVVKDIKIEPSPLWMREALHKAGVRPINNIVDITNYVMLEMGQPMHAFDLNSVRGRQIIVRRAKPDETMMTLDSKDRKLTENMLVIADAEGATGLAGIMGGENSEITDKTELVLFESACFDGANIRISGRSLGMRTEAQGRFERGVNVRLCKKALQRALALVDELGAGKVISGLIDIYPNEQPLPTIRTDVKYVQTLMGIEVPAEKMVEILEKLGIKTIAEGDHLLCQSPIWRQDIQRGADIAEEVLRIYGYDYIPSKLMEGETVSGHNSAHQKRDALLRRYLCGMGAYEAVTYSFISPKWYDALRLPENDPLRLSAKLMNPLGEDYSVMRTTLIPSMLNTLSTNINRGNAGAAFYELGKQFLPKSLPLTEQPEERPALCIGLYGENATFYTLKGMVEALLTRFGVKNVTWSRSTAPYLHPGRAAQFFVGEKLLGVLGEVHPAVAENFKFKTRAYVAEMNLNVLDESATNVGDVKDMPRFPAVQRDFAFVMKEEMPVGDVMNEMKAVAGELCEEVHLFDIYRGVPIQPGEKSVALSITLRAADRTLGEEEITAISEKIIANVSAKFGAQLRS